METRMDEVCAEVKNIASNIAELLAFVKRTVETPLRAIADGKLQQQNIGEVPYCHDVTPKTPVDGTCNPMQIILFFYKPRSFDCRLCCHNLNNLACRSRNSHIRIR